jgi:hypothetical protein
MELAEGVDVRQEQSRRSESEDAEGGVEERERERPGEEFSGAAPGRENPKAYRKERWTGRT